MKKLLIATALFLVSSLSFAGEVKLIASNDSPYTAICIASVESRQAVDAILHEHGIGRSDIRSLSCNGMSLSKFAAIHRNANEKMTEASIKVFAFREATSGRETSLCIAAATSNEEYSRLKDQLFSNASSNVHSVVCNELPIQTFARRYGNAEFRI